MARLLHICNRYALSHCDTSHYETSHFETVSQFETCTILRHASYWDFHIYGNGQYSPLSETISETGSNSGWKLKMLYHRLYQNRVKIVNQNIFLKLKHQPKHFCKKHFSVGYYVRKVRQNTFQKKENTWIFILFTYLNKTLIMDMILPIQ